jgi:polyhydroxybutyrate depolymerase
MLRGSWKTGVSGAFGALPLMVVAACNSSGPPLPDEGGKVSTPAPPGPGGAGNGAMGAARLPPPSQPGNRGEGPASIGGPLDGSGAGAGGGMIGAGGGPIQSDAGAPSEEVPGSVEFRTGPSPGCSNGALQAVSGRGTLTTSSGERTFELHVPPNGSAPRPLVLALHGYTLNGIEQERMTGFSRLADNEGFIVVYPNGLGSPTSWNAGPCCSYDDQTRDDIGFLSDLIDYLGERLCIDQGRVYSTGFSNGGMMSYRLACQMADRIAAIASVAGSMVLPPDECHPARPVPLMHTHGTADPIVPFDGGSGPTWLTPAGETPQVFPSVAEEVALFATLNGCSGETESIFSELDTDCTRRPICSGNAAVMSCTVDGGGHTWPGSAGNILTSLVTGPTSPTLPTTEVMWDFLKVHQLPE